MLILFSYNYNERYSEFCGKLLMIMFLCWLLFFVKILLGRAGWFCVLNRTVFQIVFPDRTLFLSFYHYSIERQYYKYSTCLFQAFIITITLTIIIGWCGYYAYQNLSWCTFFTHLQRITSYKICTMMTLFILLLFIRPSIMMKIL